jgi:hypothetical protein
MDRSGSKYAIRDKIHVQNLKYILKENLDIFCK